MEAANLSQLPSGENVATVIYGMQTGTDSGIVPYTDARTADARMSGDIVVTQYEPTGIHAYQRESTIAGQALRALITFWR